MNSFFYGLSRSVGFVTFALNILGVDQLGDLALAKVVMRKFNGIPKYLINFDLFWKHKIACGLMVKEIAVLFGETNAENFYLLGLPHDIGNLVMYEESPAISRTCLSQVDYEKADTFIR